MFPKNSLIRLKDKKFLENQRIAGKVVEGTVLFEGRNLLELSESDMVHMRGDRMSMIFQQPQSSLNPVFKVGDQVAEVLQIHQNLGKEESWNKAVDLIRLVGIPDPDKKRMPILMRCRVGRRNGS
jgi:ABC-type microcin C transport system duplicated ATPase subunit YejF